MQKSLLVCALALILAGSGLAHLVQTDFGTVEVSDLRFAGQDGHTLSALLYVPEGVTNDNPAPAVLTMHGYINSRETQSGFAIEFARRGYVVLSMDMSGHGFSQQIPDQLTRGAYDGLKLLSNLPFVERDNIALEGHSMGGWSTLSAAGRAPELVNTLILVGSSSETYGSPQVLPDSGFNYSVVFSKYDEFSELMWGVTRPQEIVETEKLMAAFGTEEPVVPNRLYGSFDDLTARKLYIPDSTHPGQHLSKEAIGNTVDFLQEAIPAPNPRSASDQIWHYKELGTLLGFLGMVLMIFAVAKLLLSTKYFQSLCQPLPETPRLSGSTWWLGAVVATAIPALTFFLFQEWGTSWFAPSAFWPQSLTNGFVVWAVLNGLIALGLFLLWHYKGANQQQCSLLHYGLAASKSKGKSPWSYVGKSLLLGILPVLAAYLMLSLMHWMFLVDFRWWVVGIKPLTIERFLIFLRYLPPFIVFFLINGLVLHGQFRLPKLASSTKTLAVWMLANGAINVVGLMVLVALQVGYLLSTETLFFPTESLRGIIAYQFIPLLSLAAFVSTYFFKKTGTIYAGAFANAVFVTWYIIAGQAIQFVG